MLDLNNNDKGIYMKKTLTIVLLALFSAVCFGQNRGPIKFLGIPIDGTKSQFVNKLHEKGFTYSTISETYKGQFNGKDVDVFIHTNHNLVDRVYVAFPNTTENDIKIEFNHLLNQFQNNSKYLELVINEVIPEEEDISYEITVNNKRYNASFSYFDSDRDLVAFMNELLNKLSSFYTAEQLVELREHIRDINTVQDDQLLDKFAKISSEMREMAVGKSNNNVSDSEKSRMFTAYFMDGMRSLADGDVWFMIHNNYGRYQIGLYYDNLHNKAHGEDL